ncbi:MAG: TIR domain-containing protein [Planctomycetota bacterium]
MLYSTLKSWLFGYDVFISYPQSCADYARQLHQKLRKRRCKSFLDTKGLRDGTWESELQRLVRSSRAIAIISDESLLESSYVEGEVQAFRDARKPVIPIDKNGFLEQVRKAAASPIPSEIWVSKLAKDLAVPERGNSGPSEDTVVLLLAKLKAIRVGTIQIAALVFISAILLGSACAVTLFWRSQERARLASQRQAQVSKSRRLAGLSQAQAESPSLAILLAAEAVRAAGGGLTVTAEAHQALRDSLVHTGGSLLLRPDTGRIDSITVAAGGDMAALTAGGGVAMRRSDDEEWVESDLTIADARAIAWSRDGQDLLVGDAEGQVWIWDGRPIRVGSCIAPVAIPNVTAVAASAGCTWVAAIARELGVDSITLWRRRGDEFERGDIGPSADMADAEAITFSPNDRRLLFRGRGGMRLLSLPPAGGVSTPMSMLPHVDYDAQGRRVMDAVFRSSDVVLVLDRSVDGNAYAVPSIRLVEWRITQDKLTSAPRADRHLVFESHLPRDLRSITSACIASDGRLIAVGDRGSVHVLLVNSNQEDLPFTRVAELRGHDHPVTRVGFAGTRWLLSVARESARVWDLSKYTDVLASPLAMRVNALSPPLVRFDPLSRFVVAAPYLGTRVKCWDLESGCAAVVPDRDLRSDVRDLAVGAKTLIIACAASFPDQSLVERWALGSELEPQPTFALDERRGWLSASALAVTRDGPRIAFTCKGGVIHLQDSSDGTVSSVSFPDAGTVLALAFSPDDSWLIAGGSQAVARAWQLEGGKPREPSVALGHHTHAVSSIAVSSDSRLVITGGHQQVARVWDLARIRLGMPSLELRPGPTQVLDALRAPPDWMHYGVQNEEYDSGMWRRAVHVSASGRWAAAVAGRDVIVRDLSLPSASALLLRKHTARVYAARISPDERWVATASADGSAGLWDLWAERPEESAIFLRLLEGGEVNLVDFSPDSRWLLAAGGGIVQLWELEMGALLNRAERAAGRRKLSEREWRDVFGDALLRATFPVPDGR